MKNLRLIATVYLEDRWGTSDIQHVVSLELLRVELTAQNALNPLSDLPLTSDPHLFLAFFLLITCQF